MSRRPNNWRSVVNPDGLGHTSFRSQVVADPQVERGWGCRLGLPTLWVKYDKLDGKRHIAVVHPNQVRLENPNTLTRRRHGTSSGHPNQRVYCVRSGGAMGSELDYPITHWKIARPTR